MSKILFIAMNLNSGGAERQTVSIAKALKTSGHEVHVICYSYGNFYQQDLEKAGVKVIWTIENNYLLRLLKFRKHIRNGGYNCVISLLVTPNIINLISAIGGRSWKVVIGERSAKSSFFNSIKGYITKNLIKYADYLVCNSQNALNLWEEFVPRYSYKLECIYNLINDIKVDIVYAPLRYDRVNIVVAASYQPLKNMSRLILAVANLTTEERERLHIDWYGQTSVANYGTKPYDAAQLLIQEKNLMNVISLNPSVKNIYEYMYQADAIALVSEVEGLPNVICEALMLGKPIIMSNVSDYKVLVGNGNGFVCKYDDVDSITRAFRSLIYLSQEELIHKGKLSREVYESTFSNKVILENWLKLIL